MTPAPESGPGTIAVTAEPLQANVYLDDVRNGMTPRNLKRVALGSHTIRVTRPGYAPEEKTVTLTADQPAARADFTLRAEGAAPSAAPRPTRQAAERPRAQPAPSGQESLVIQTRPPGARVRVDDRDVGVSPVTVAPIAPGKHKVDLQLAGYRRWVETLTVTEGRARRVTASLERIEPR